MILARDPWAAGKGPGLACDGRKFTKELWFISLAAVCGRLQGLLAVFGDKKGRRGFREINEGSV